MKQRLIFTLGIPAAIVVIGARVSVLKALGDENNPAHWEIWESPIITTDRP